MALALLATTSHAVDDEATLRMDQRLHRIRQQCGELCNLRRPTIPHASERFSHSKAAVDCGWLLADGTGIDATLEQSSPPNLVAVDALTLKIAVRWPLLARDREVGCGVLLPGGNSGPQYSSALSLLVNLTLEAGTGPPGDRVPLLAICLGANHASCEPFLD